MFDNTSTSPVESFICHHKRAYSEARLIRCRMSREMVRRKCKSFVQTESSLYNNRLFKLNYTGFRSAEFLMKTEQIFAGALDLIEKSQRILITTHTRPDGDACASVLAVAESLSRLNKAVEYLFLSEPPKWYDFLFERPPTILGKDVSSEQLAERYAQVDLIIIADTNSNSQLSGFEDFLKHTDASVLVFDHHITNDGLGDVELIDTSAAATGLIVFDFMKYAQWPITRTIAHHLFVAVATDTGWFHFSNTDSRTFFAAGELIRSGAGHLELYRRLYQNLSTVRFKLMVAALNTLELNLNERYASQYITQEDFRRTGAAYSDTENLIDECRRIATVEVAALFVEQKDGTYRCSLRSDGPVDVRKIAQKFGGGGHKMAAATFVQGPIEEAKELIKAEIGKQLG